MYSVVTTWFVLSFLQVDTSEQPKIDLIGGGAIILYTSVYFFITTNPQVVTVMCNITPWLIALGYSLCYGTILAKMVRVYYIFDNPTSLRKKVHRIIKMHGTSSE